jgi:hypothetical protein
VEVAVVVMVNSTTIQQVVVVLVAQLLSLMFQHLQLQQLAQAALAMLKAVLLL